MAGKIVERETDYNAAAHQWHSEAPLGDDNWTVYCILRMWLCQMMDQFFVTDYEEAIDLMTLQRGVG